MFNICLSSIGIDSQITVKGVSSIEAPNSNSVIFCQKIDENIDTLLTVENSLIITHIDDDSRFADKLKLNNHILYVNNPKFEYSKVINMILVMINYYDDFNSSHFQKVGESYISNKNVRIADNVQLGIGVVIGPNTNIEEGVVISDGVKIYGNTKIGSGSSVGMNTVIGHAGFGFSKEGEISIRMPHLGGVIIAENVDVGCLTTIVSGAINPTVIGYNTKIDDHVHIGHNVDLGENCIVTACSEICRSKIHNNVWIGPNSSIRQGVTIGAGSLIGIGSVVTKEVGEGDTVCGNPADRLDVFKKARKAIREL